MHTSSVAPGRHTIRKGCRQTGRWIARLCLALPLLALPLAHASEPPAAGEAPQRDGAVHASQQDGAVHTPQRDGAVHITRAELLTVPGTGYSDPPRLAEDARLPGDEWREISLPHTAGRELVPTPLGGIRTLTDWYRIDLSGLAPSAQQRLLYLPRWKTLGHIAVYGDGVLLYQSHGSPVHNGYNHPLLLPLNAAAGTPSPTSVLIRVDRLRSSGSGFSTVWVGDQASLVWRYQARQLLQVQLPFMGSAAFLAVGAFAFAVWLGKRREPLYLLFFAISALAFLRTVHYYAGGSYLPISDELFEWMTVASLIWLIIAIHLFLERLHQQPSPWLTRSSLALATGCSIATLPHLSPSIASPLPHHAAAQPGGAARRGADLRGEPAQGTAREIARGAAGGRLDGLRRRVHLLRRAPAEQPGEPGERLHLALRDHQPVLRLLVHHVRALHRRVRRGGPAEQRPGPAPAGARGRAGAKLFSGCA
jgi:hypothetical protein